MYGYIWCIIGMIVVVMCCLMVMNSVGFSVVSDILWFGMGLLFCGVKVLIVLVVCMIVVQNAGVQNATSSILLVMVCYFLLVSTALS